MCVRACGRFSVLVLHVCVYIGTNKDNNAIAAFSLKSNWCVPIEKRGENIEREKVVF